MAKEYWLEWARMDDFEKGIGLPGGYSTLKEARIGAVKNVKKNHPIVVDGNLIMRLGAKVYQVKNVKMNGNYVYVRIPILKDGSLSKTKPTKSDIVSKSDLKCLEY